MKKLELITNYSSNKSPYKIFSSGFNFGKELKTVTKSSSNSHHFKAKNKRNNRRDIFLPLRPFTAKTKDDIQVSSISKNLKLMTLSNELYLNYMDYYSNLTQDYCFKSPKISNYPILKNEKYLSIKSHQNFIPIPKNKDFHQKDSIFFNSLKKINQNKTKREIEIKSYIFKNEETKLRKGKQRPESARPNHIDNIEFQNLLESEIYDSELLKQIGIKNIDIYNSKVEKNKNFDFFNEYLEQINSVENLMNDDNSLKNIEFHVKTSNIKENLSFKLYIYSLCFKFYLLENNEKPQKLYFPFKLLPLFYLLDIQSFKVFISEIIYYNNNKNCLSFVDNDLLLNKIKKYYYFISNNIKSNKKYLNNLTYNKNELTYFLVFDWIISLKKNIENNNIRNYKCYKLKINLPKIKFFEENKKIKIIRHLNKHIVANLIFNNFDNWEKFILFDLFSNRKFKYITNLLMEDKPNMIKSNKIILNKDPSRYPNNNNNFSFYLSEMGKNYSNFYIFIPYIILVLSGEYQKRYQKINLTWKESKNLLKFKNYWGIINTLLKCMLIDNITNDIFFRFELLDSISNDLNKIIIKENSKSNNNNTKNNKNNNMKNALFNNKNTSIKNIYYYKEKDREKNRTKYETDKLEISVLDCSLKKININQIKSESKYYKIPQKLSKEIFEIKTDKELFNTNFNDASIIAKCIGECSKSIINAPEENIKNEEQKMMKKAKDSMFIKIIDKFKTEKNNTIQINKIMTNTFDKYSPLKIRENSINRNYTPGKAFKNAFDYTKKKSFKSDKNFEEKTDKKYKIKYKGEYNIMKSNSKKKKLKIQL